MADGRAIILRFIRRGFAGLALAVVVVYAGDSLLFHFKADKYGSVRVNPYYAVPQKDHKIQYMFDDPFDQPCVNSLFPREGDTPCWYLKNHREKRIDI